MPVALAKVRLVEDTNVKEVKLVVVAVTKPGRYKLDETFNGVAKAVDVAVIKP